MSSFTSTHFASACAAGTDWRDTSKAVLEQLDAIRTDGANFNFGILYISDRLADDATSILNLFKSVLNIENWVGSIGIGILGCGQSHVDEPAISAMIGRMPESSFCIFPDKPDGEDEPPSQERIKNWLSDNMSVFGIVHGDPTAEKDPQNDVRDLERLTNCFLIGGMTSSRHQHYQIADTIFQNALSGAFFNESVQIATTLSQGCKPVGELHTITKADNNTILEINDRPAVDVLQDDLRMRAAIKLGHDTDDLPDTDISMIESSDYIPDEFKPLFQKHIHIGLPLTQSDQGDYLVRNILRIDAEERSITISDPVLTGQHALFVERDGETVNADLSHSLVELRKRIQHERGSFEPKAALYISCIARAFSNDAKQAQTEVQLIRDIIGDVPMTGFYAGGEINNAHVYSYSGVLTLFF